MPAEHVAILDAALIDAILEGRKTIETRLSVHRRAPFGAVTAGDTVYLKRRGGGFAARARVHSVAFLSNLTPGGVRDIQAAYNDRVLGTRAYWRGKRRARYASLIWLEEARETDTGPCYVSPGRTPSRHAWFVLGNGSD